MKTSTIILKTDTGRIAVMLSAILLIGTVQICQADTSGKDATAQAIRQIEMINAYLNVVTTVHSVAVDPEKAAIMQLQQLEEMNKQAADKSEYISLLNEVIASTPSAAVRNVAYMKLVDVYKNTGDYSTARSKIKQALFANIKQLR